MGNPPTAENFHVTAWQKQKKKRAANSYYHSSKLLPSSLRNCLFAPPTWECTYTWELKVKSSCHNTEKHGESKILPIPALSTAYYCCFVLADIALQYLLLLLPFSFTQNKKSTFPLNQHSYAEMERVTGETSTDKGSDPAAFHVNDKNRQGSREQHMARSAHFCGQGKPQVSDKVYPLSPCLEPLRQWLFSSHSVFDPNKWI